MSFTRDAFIPEDQEAAKWIGCIFTGTAGAVGALAMGRALETKVIHNESYLLEVMRNFGRIIVGPKVTEKSPGLPASDKVEYTVAAEMTPIQGGMKFGLLVSAALVGGFVSYVGYQYYRRGVVSRQFEHMKKCIDSISQSYQDLQLGRVFVSDRPVRTRIAETYLPLCLVDGQAESKRQRDLLSQRRTGVRDGFQDVVNPVPLEEIFLTPVPGNREGRIIKKLWVQGEAGAGKTTLLEYIAYLSSLPDPALKPPWLRTIDLVVIVYSSDLTSSTVLNQEDENAGDVDLLKIIWQLSSVSHTKTGLTQEDVGRLYEDFKRHKQQLNVLYVVDAVNQTSLRNSKPRVKNAFNVLFQQSYVIASSRIAQAPSAFNADHVIWVKGLDQAGQEAYVRRQFELEPTETLPASFTDFSRNYPQLKSWLGNPTLLELICLILKSDGFSEFEADYLGQLTPLYNHAIKQLVYAWFGDIDTPPARLRQIFLTIQAFLANMAHHALVEKNRAIIRPDTIEYSLAAPISQEPGALTFSACFHQMGIVVEELFKRIGFLIPTSYHHDPLQQDYRFTHFTIHEYFAAIRLSQTLSALNGDLLNEQVAGLGKRFYDDPDTYVMVFFVGHVTRMYPDAVTNCDVAAQRYIQYCYPPTIENLDFVTDRANHRGAKKHIWAAQFYRHWAQALSEIPTAKFYTLTKAVVEEMKQNRALQVWLEEKLGADGRRLVRALTDNPDAVWYYAWFCAARFANLVLLAQYSRCPGVNVNYRSEEVGYTALFYALSDFPVNLETLNYLLFELKVDANVRDQSVQRFNALMFMMRRMFLDQDNPIVQAQFSHILTLLRRANMDFNAVDAFGRTALISARRDCYVRDLIEIGGADINHVSPAVDRDLRGGTVLHMLNTEIPPNEANYQLYLRHGANPSIVDADGRTATVSAENNELPPAIAELLRQHAVRPVGYHEPPRIMIASAQNTQDHSWKLYSLTAAGFSFLLLAALLTWYYFSEDNDDLSFSP